MPHLINRGHRARALIAVSMLVLCLSGCQSGSGAEQLMETARFEELQNNPEHARQLYQQVLKDYPNAPQAKQASERLTALSVPPPP